MAHGTAIGIRVKSGWASAILVGTGGSSPLFLNRARLVLADPAIPKSTQPYHRGFGSLEKDTAKIERLTAIVHRATASSLVAFVDDCRRQGYQPHSVALVVGSTIDPARISNEHMRAHAYEGQLFRTALARAAAGARLAVTIMRVRDLPTLVTTVLGSNAHSVVGALGKAAGRPWRADEKQAAMAAWYALRQGRPQRA
jgi:hypothetical protein